MLTSTKLGKEIGLTKQTICRLAKDGRIPYIQLPSGHRRFDLEAVKAALVNNTMASTFLPPLSECSVDERRRILRDIWYAERTKISATPRPKFNGTNYEEYEKAFEKHTEILTKHDDDFLEADDRIKAEARGKFIDTSGSDEGAK